MAARPRHGAASVQQATVLRRNRDLLLADVPRQAKFERPVVGGQLCTALQRRRITFCQAPCGQGSIRPRWPMVLLRTLVCLSPTAVVCGWLFIVLCVLSP